MARVRTGIEVLAARGFAPLKGQRVGLVTNPTGLLPDLRSTIDVRRQYDLDATIRDVVAWKRTQSPAR